MLRKPLLFALRATKCFGCAETVTPTALQQLPPSTPIGVIRPSLLFIFNKFGGDFCEKCRNTPLRSADLTKKVDNA